MSEKHPIVKISLIFFDFVNFFQKKYVNKKEIKVNLYDTFEDLDKSVNVFLGKLNSLSNEYNEELKTIEKELSEIEKCKKERDSLKKNILIPDLDYEEFENIEGEIKLLDEKIELSNHILKKKEEVGKNIFDINEIKIFIDNMVLFSTLLYSLIKIYEENINKKEFEEVNKNLTLSSNIALLNMMKIIGYKYYEDMSYENEFIDHFFTIQQFYTLLALSNNSLKLMDYGVNKQNKKHQEDMEKHLNLLKIQNFVLLMLGGLCVRNNDQERKFAHYTNLDVGVKLATNTSHVRLNSVDFMNDPTEGKILKDFLNLKDIRDDNIHINTFLTCFTFNHNSLNQFRLYGNTDDIECSGLSLVFESLFFAQGFEKATTSRVYYKLPIFRCIYLDYFSGYFEVARRNKFTFFQEYKDKVSAEKAWNKYSGKIKLIENKIKKYFDEMRALIEILYKDNDLKVISLINNLVNPLRFLIKHFAFQEEQECRMMRIENIENSEVVFDMHNNKSYIDYKLDANKYLSNIYIGEKSKLNYTYLIKEITKLNGRLPKVRVTDNPFRSEKKDFIYSK